MPDKDKQRIQKIMDASKQWMQSYVQSPKYKERLSNFYKYPDYIQRQRNNQIENIQFTDAPNGILDYISDKNTVRISPDEIRNRNLNPSEVGVHEMSHATNRGIVPGSNLSTREESYIFDRNLMEPSVREGHKEAALRREIGISEYLKISPSLHDRYPSENKSDIDAFRYLLNQEGLYDARTQDITPEILQKAKQNPAVKKSFSTKRLFQNFNDDKLIDIMNKVAYSPQAPTTYAEYGGSLNFSSKPAYKRWLGYVHATGLAESTPGNQKISINRRSHKVKHAFGGELGSNIYGYNPYSVSNGLENRTPYIPYSPTGSPLNQAMANINNYFATEPGNMIPNEVSLEGPNPNQPEYLLNADTNQVSQSNYKPTGSSPSKGKQFKMPNIRINTAGPILALAGLTGQMAQQQDQIDEQSRKARRQMNQETYNPFPYGTGSQAIFGKGGKLKGKKMENGGYMIGQTYNLTQDEINLLSSQGYSFDIIS